MTRSEQPQLKPLRNPPCNTWIVICMLAIVVTIIGLIELHVRRLIAHSSLMAPTLVLWNCAEPMTFSPLKFAFGISI